eukprot:4433451-Amphidinium_carterae.1
MHRALKVIVTVHIDDPIVAGTSEGIRMFFKLVGTELKKVKETQHGASRLKYSWKPTSAGSRWKLMASRGIPSWKGSSRDTSGTLSFKREWRRAVQWARPV